jgi:hypothetical protein
MNYQDIKKGIAEAGRLIDAGDLAAADKKIRSMVGKGLTRNDLDANLTKNQIKQLRLHTSGGKRKGAKKNPGQKYHHVQAYQRAIEGANWLVKALEAKSKADQFDAAMNALLAAQSGLTEVEGTRGYDGIFTPKLHNELRRIRRDANKLLREVGNIPKHKAKAKA